ncbi:hypothetical protein H4684_003127 [Desulfomicrobium macestii]|uniref:Uncharacterized protein n=1 Tax=Desulfomicrobium macestii TaxID=90731 RepID=A0ABR9H6X0_9BACT|nr:hypothetical protein [Desulfomicrobium macestii]
MVFVVAVRPKNFSALQLDGVLIEKVIPADPLDQVAMWPPAEVAALQYDFGPLLVDESVERSKICVYVAHDDDFHITIYFFSNFKYPK